MLNVSMFSLLHDEGRDGSLLPAAVEELWVTRLVRPQYGHLRHPAPHLADLVRADCRLLLLVGGCGGRGRVRLRLVLQQCTVVKASKQNR